MSTAESMNTEAHGKGDLLESRQMLCQSVSYDRDLCQKIKINETLPILAA